MGEDFLRKKTKHFKKLQNKAFQNLFKKENLFSNRPELLQREFYGDITDRNANLQNGKHLIGKFVNGHMDLLDGGEVIGKIDETNAKELKALAKDLPSVSNIFDFTVIRFSQLGSIVYIQISG